MSIDPINHIPGELRAGDTWFWELSDKRYPADSWSFVAYFSNPANDFSVTSTANNTAHRFNVSAATTEEYEYGGYSYQIRAEHASDGRKFTVGEGWIDVLPPMDKRLDHRNHVKKVLDALESVIEGRATNDQMSMAIAGRSISRMSPSELAEFHGWYAQQWEQIVARQRKTSFGKSSQNQIRVRFT